MCRQHGPAAVDLLAAMAGLIPGERAESESTRLAAVKELLDRGFGRATLPLATDPDQPMTIEFTWAPATPQPQGGAAPTIEGQPAGEAEQRPALELVWKTC